MALESVSVAETLIQRDPDNENDDLEDGEIPSDEDDDTVVPTPTPKVPPVEPPRPSKAKGESPKSNKNFDNKFSKNKKQSTQSAGNSDRANKFSKGPTEDWAGDVEKAIKAALDKDKSKHQDSNSKSSKNNRSKNRKRSRDDKEEDRIKDQKRRKVSDEENGNEDEDEMLFVRGASPVRKGSHENSSPARRNNDHENYDSGSDYEDRPNSNRHRDNENKRGGRGGRRGGKNERGGGKNKGRNQTRNERNGRRNQANNDHGQDPDAICVYFMQGKCHRGDDCPFSHNALPPRKMELCKFYLMDCCAKRDKCLYMHHDFPCKFFHTGLKCSQGDNCKFSHQPLNEQVKNILLKHLETAPKEILGNFPRLSRDGALTMINNTEKNLAQGQEANSKIPSLFELNIGNEEKEEGTGGIEDLSGQKTTTTKERKPSGKKTRWGSDEDRVPYEQIMLLQSANQLGLQLPNAALDLAVQEHLQQSINPQKITMDFYNEVNSSDSNKAKSKEDFTKDLEEDEIRAQSKVKGIPGPPKDVDLRQLLSGTNKPTRVVYIADEIANITKSKEDEESDQEEESDLVIEMPVDEEEPEKEKDLSNIEDSQASQFIQIEKPPSPNFQSQEMPPNLPKKAQELFMRIQQQQRSTEESFKNLEDEKNEESVPQDDWYSDDDDDADESGGLTIDVRNDEDQEMSEEMVKIDTKSPPPSDIPQPAPFVDKLGDLSKIDISAEVSKLLSSLKAQSNSPSPAQQKYMSNSENTEIKIKHDQNSPVNDKEGILDSIKVEKEEFSPKSSPPHVTGASRDPRMLRDPREFRDPRDPRESRDPRERESRDPRDPRQRREDQKSVSAVKSEAKDHKSYRLETSIYSSGIIAMDTPMDTDLRARADQDHRRKDMDLRQCYADFGDTDLRFVGGTFTNASGKSDVDLRQMLTLPFKPAPTHVPCTEIDGSIASHPPIFYKVHVVDIPRPDYTGLKLTKNDPQVKYDPRLRKIFRLPLTDIADSPMSPPPVKLDLPKSPPQIRADPRRKALESQGLSQNLHPQGMNPAMNPRHQGPQEMNMNMGGGPYMPGPLMQGMPMMMGPNPMMGNMGPMMGGPMPPNMQMMGPNMGQNMGPNMGPNLGPNMGQNMGPNMGQNMGSNMGPNMGQNMGPNMGQNMGPNMGPNMGQNFDPRFNAQRNNGAGLLGPGPMGYGPDDGPNFQGGYPNGNFNNFGPGPDHRNFGNNNDGPNFGNGSDWNGNQNQNQNRRGGRMRRRNRNKNGPSMNNRSPS